jgi:glycosyltransferase involved in cell wall biosynthesis
LRDDSLALGRPPIALIQSRASEDDNYNAPNSKIEYRSRDHGRFGFSYGRACLAGVKAARDADLLIFMDGDGADDPDDLRALLEPILSGRSDLVIGSRLLGRTERGALTLAQRFGNRLATGLMRLIWGGQFTDLGPFRAITRPAYEALNMQAETFGWTVEMQVRALKQKLRCAEVPVNYRRRIGVSKTSGTVKGVCLAGWFILGTVFKEALTRHGAEPRSVACTDPTVITVASSATRRTL